MKRIILGILMLLPVLGHGQAIGGKTDGATKFLIDNLGGFSAREYLGVPLRDSAFWGTRNGVRIYSDVYRRKADSAIMYHNPVTGYDIPIASQDAITPEVFGAKGNGIANDFVAVKKAFSLGVNVTLLGTYYIGDSTLNIHGANFTVNGNGTGRIKGTKDILLQNSDSLINVTFNGITLEGTGTAGDFFGLFTSFDKKINGLKFLNCGFTAPASISNGVKIINQGSELCQNIVFDGCNFYDLGQMGIEFQNHNYDSVYRYQDVTIVNNTFNNLGLASTFGMAISFSGRGQYLTFSNNHIYKAKNIGIELAIGQKDVVITNNIIDSCKTGCAPFSFSNGTNTWDHLNVVIMGNKSYSASRVNFYRLNNSIIANNVFAFAGGSGYVQMTSGYNTKFQGNIITTDGSFGVFANATTGKVFQNCTFSDNQIRTTAINAASIQIDGTNGTVTGNTICNNYLYKNTGGSYTAFTGGATGSSKYNYPEGIAEAVSGTTWRIDDATGKYFGAGLSNYTAAGNGEVLTGIAGVQIRVSDAASSNTALTVRTFGTGRDQDWQNTSGTRTASMLPDGGLRATGLYNFTQDINSSIEPTSNGIIFKRTINSGTFPVGTFNQAGTSPGNIVEYQKVNATVSSIDINGFFDSPSTTATIDFGSVSASAELAAPSTITLTGAAVGDIVVIGAPNTAGIVYKGVVSSTNTITLYACNFTVLPVDPASGSFKISVLK